MKRMMHADSCGLAQAPYWNQGKRAITLKDYLTDPALGADKYYYVAK
jgi:hypothetical protein